MLEEFPHREGGSLPKRPAFHVIVPAPWHSISMDGRDEMNLAEAIEAY